MDRQLLNDAVKLHREMEDILNFISEIEYYPDTHIEIHLMYMLLKKI